MGKQQFVQLSDSDDQTNEKSKPIQKKTQNSKQSNKKSQSHSNSQSNSRIQSIQISQPPLVKPSTRTFIYMPNVQFYLNKMSSSPNGTFIDLIHKHWWGNYILLQTNHSYIQWLFPNSFQSRFNQNAKPLTKEQAKHFRQNLEIARRYVHSYEMILEFFGMKLRNKITGEVTRTIVPRFKDRYDQTLLSAYHNHLRVSRILCSLTEVGFAFYAREWCKFLKKQIYEHNGRLIRLKHMDVYKHWRPYQGDNKKRSNKIDCQDVPNIYLRQLWKQQGYNPLAKQRSKWVQVYQMNKATITLEQQSDQQKIQTKRPQRQSKNESKHQPKQPSRTVIDNKSKLKGEKIQKPTNNSKKIQILQKLQTSQQDNFSEPDSLDQSLSQQEEVQDKWYGRRGSKQYQKMKSQLTNSQNDIQKEKLFRQIRKQQEHQHKMEQQIKSQLQDEKENHVKKQMRQIREDFNKKLQEFRKKGPRLAQTIQERQKRMMMRNLKQSFTEHQSQSQS